MAAIEELGSLVELTILSPPTLPALSEALTRAQAARAPFHVVHFDGHGVYDRRAGLGGLCFEDPTDLTQLERCRHQTVYTDPLGPLLRDHRIPLVFLEACQSATADEAAESVATELLKVGVAAVIAMSHSVLVETARRFVAPFMGQQPRGSPACCHHGGGPSGARSGGRGPRGKRAGDHRAGRPGLSAQ